MSKILIASSTDLTTQNIRAGYANAFKHLGHEVAWLNYKESPFDVFFRELPEIFLMSSLELSCAMVKACEKYQPKVILFLATDQKSSNSEYNLAETLAKTKSDIYPFVFWQDSKPNPWQIWFNNGFMPYSTTPGADTIRFKRGRLRQELQCDVSYIGTWRPEKAAILLQLEKEYEQGNKVRIYGYGSWNHPLHVGSIESDQDFADVAASSTVNLVQDNMEKLFKTELCGGICAASLDRGLERWGDRSPPENRSYINRVTELLKCLES